MKKVTVEFTSSPVNKMLKNTTATFESQTNASLALGVPIPKLAQVEAKRVPVVTSLGVCRVLSGFTASNVTAKQFDLFAITDPVVAKTAPVATTTGRPVYKLSVGTTTQKFDSLTDVVNVMFTSAKYDHNLTTIKSSNPTTLYSRLYQRTKQGKASTIDIFTVTKE